jgi:hypothetical protein
MLKYKPSVIENRIGRGYMLDWRGDDKTDLGKAAVLTDFDNPPKVTAQYVKRINQIEEA